MSSFLKALKDLARIATMERSDENRYERQRANANAKQEAFICSDHQFCSGFRVHESHSLLFSSLVSLFWVQFRATLLAFPVLFWVQGSWITFSSVQSFFANANLVWVCQLYSIPSQFLRRSLPLLSTMSAMSPGDCKEHMERQRPTPLRTQVSKCQLSQSE